jgi:hypothetical protein
MVLGPGSFDLPDPRAGLAELSSYTGTLTLSFEGTEAGQPQPWSSTYVVLHTREPAAILLTIEHSETISAADPVFLGEVDGTAFEIGGDGICIAHAMDVENSLVTRQEPAALLDGLLGAEEAGQETISGVGAHHYTFDERALVLYGLAESTGEIWVASDGGYILKYLRTTTGDADYFGEGIEGTMSWEYALTDINLPVALDLPQACLGIMVSAPRLPDASNVLNLPGWLAYDTSSDVAEAAAFYQEQLPGLGWTPTREPMIGDTAILEYTQGDQTLSLMISADEATTRVNILLTRSQE